MQWAQPLQPLGAVAPQAASCGAGAASCGACLPLLTRPPLLRGGGAASHPPPWRVRVASAAPEGGSSSSFDGEEEDLSLSRELERMTAPDKYRRLASHLDLLYSVQNDEGCKPETCQCCRGTGESECSWCHGTGAMTVGDTLYCSHAGCSPCPVCRGTGACKCSSCRGTGGRAKWLSAPQ